MRYCLIFLAFTGARSGEARRATWDEIDWDELTWTIPGVRMKNGLPHKVPLSPQLVELLQHARDQNQGRCEGVIFPPERGGHYMGANILSKLMLKLDIPASPHGFRASFRNWAGARAHYIPRPAAEMVLAHKQGNQIEQDYMTSDFFEERLPVMDEWAVFLTDTMGTVISTTPEGPKDAQQEREAPPPCRPLMRKPRKKLHRQRKPQPGTSPSCRAGTAT